MNLPRSPPQRSSSSSPPTANSTRSTTAPSPTSLTSRPSQSTCCPGEQVVPRFLLNDLDIDDDGNVYFIDSSSVYQRRNYMQLIFSRESSGRVLKYDPVTKQTTVRLRDVMFSNGLSLSKDQKFSVFCQASSRLRRYWLKGEKAGRSEIFANLPGSPDNVRVNEKGEFWVAVHSFHTRIIHFSAFHPTYRKFILKLLMSTKLQFLFHQMELPGAIAVMYNHSPVSSFLISFPMSVFRIIEIASSVLNFMM